MLHPSSSRQKYLVHSVMMINNSVMMISHASLKLYFVINTHL